MTTDELRTELHKKLLAIPYSNGIINTELPKLRDFISQNLPNKLFRFRDDSDRSIQAFENDDLYYNTSTKMNDKFDCSCYIDWEYIKEKTNDMSIVSENYNTIYKNYFSLARLACFCEEVDGEHSRLMWAHYANNNKGFAVAYKPDLSFFKFGDERQGYLHLYPVIYSNERYNATEFALHKHLVKLNKEEKVVGTMEYILAAILKEDIWSYEKEWRSISFKSNKDDSDNISVKRKPVAIYLGIDMQEMKKDWLIKIAKRKNITIYKMYIDETDKDYNIKSKVINDNA